MVVTDAGAEGLSFQRQDGGLIGDYLHIYDDIVLDFPEFGLVYGKVIKICDDENKAWITFTSKGPDEKFFLYKSKQF